MEITWNWSDLLLNLVSEGIGILVTVYWIERNAKKREQARWKPTKHFIYSKLMDITWDIFDEFSPPSLLKDKRSVMYRFGQVSSGIVKDFRDISLEPSILESLLEKDLAGQIANRRLNVWRKCLTQAREEVDKVINDAAIFLEPEELSHIFLLRREIDPILVYKLPMSEDRFSNWGSFKGVISRIRRLLMAAQNLEKWLIEQSSGELQLDPSLEGWIK